jgi:glutaredoxin
MSFLLSLFGGSNKSKPKSKTYRTPGSPKSKPKSELKIVIWTIKNCKYCKDLKKFLDKKKLQYEEKILDNPETIKQFKKKLPSENGVPQVFVNRKHIGTYNEAVKYFS